MTARSLQPFLAVAALLLSGCAANHAATSRHMIDESDSGTIEGLVTDEELRPVPSVLIEVTSIPTINATTGTDGHFVLIDVPPGKRSVSAHRPGYANLTKAIQVNDTETTNGVTFILHQLPINIPYPEPLINKGLLQHGVGLIVTATCANCADPTNKFDFEHRHLPADFSGILVESQWKTTDWLGFDLVDRAVEGGNYWRIRAPSPVHKLVERCGNYLNAPYFADRPMLCHWDQVSDNHADLETWYVGDFQEETHNLDPACKNNPVLGYKAGCYGVGYAAEITYTNYVTIFHGALPADAANLTFAPTG